MGRADVDTFCRFGIDPASDHSSAGKYERVWPLAVDDRQFEIAIERRAADRKPHEPPIRFCFGLKLSQIIRPEFSACADNSFLESPRLPLG